MALSPYSDSGKRIIAAAVLAVFSGAQTLAAPLTHNDAPVSATIDQLIKSPKSYAGKTVRLEGQFDNCIAFNCNLCPIDMTRETFDRKKCLVTDFDEFSGKEVYGAQQPMEPVFRFATVTMDAGFYPGCIDGTLLCTDKAVVLSDARVIAVHSRKNALNGLVGGYDFGPLVAADPEDQKQMQSEIDGLPDYPAKDQTRFFVNTGENSPNSSAAGLACVCLAQSCEQQWPTRFFGGFDSAANPFRCWHLEKLPIGWRVVPGDY